MEIVSGGECMREGGNRIGQKMSPNPAISAEENLEEVHVMHICRRPMS